MVLFVALTVLEICTLYDAQDKQNKQEKETDAAFQGVLDRLNESQAGTGGSDASPKP